MSLCVEIAYADGTREERIFTLDRVLVGRGPHADFDVQTAPEIEEEHLLILPRRNGCWVAVAADARVKPTLAGAPFEHGLLPWGAELDVGSVTIKVKRASESKRAASPWYAVGLVPLALVAYMLWPGQNPAGGTPVRAPELELAEPGCDEGKGSWPQAQQKAAAAAALADRYPYDARDGLRAAQLWLDAASCFEVARQAAAAEQVRERGRAMLARVIEDYKAQLLVMEQARRRGDDARLLSSVRVLQRFLADSPGAYRDYLGRLERQTVMQLEKKNKHVKYKS